MDGINVPWVVAASHNLTNNKRYIQILSNLESSLDSNTTIIVQESESNLTRLVTPELTSCRLQSRARLLHHHPQHPVLYNQGTMDMAQCRVYLSLNGRRSGHNWNRSRTDLSAREIAIEWVLWPFPSYHRGQKAPTVKINFTSIWSIRRV